MGHNVLNYCIRNSLVPNFMDKILIFISKM